MNRLIAVIGYSDSGKTTLIESLIPELKRRGYRIGTVKHSHHPPAFDKKGKDSRRHYDAGADTVMIYADNILAMIKHRQPSQTETSVGLKELAKYFEDVDLVIAEGFKGGDFPKIEVYRAAEETSPLYLSVDSVIAVVTDADISVPVRRFGFDAIPKLVDMIEQTVLKG